MSLLFSKFYDVETRLVREVDDRIIDADAMVRRRKQSNGVPDWHLYRAIYCGDARSLRTVKDWAIAFADCYARAGGVRSDARSDEFIGLAALDAVHLLLTTNPIKPDDAMAHDAGVDLKTYRRLRRVIFRVMDMSLRAYWGELIAAYIAVGRIYAE